MEDEAQRREINELDIRLFFKGRQESSFPKLIANAGTLEKSLLETQRLRNLVGRRSRERWEACYGEGVNRQTFIENVIAMAREPEIHIEDERECEGAESEAEEFTMKAQAYGYLMYAKWETVLEIAKSGGVAQINGKLVDMSQLEFTAEQWAWCVEGNRRVKDRVEYMIYPTRRYRPEATQIVIPKPGTAERLNLRAGVLATEPASRHPKFETIQYYESNEALLSYLSKYLRTPIQIEKFLRNGGFYDMGSYGVLDFRKFLSTNDHFELALAPTELSNLNDFVDYVMASIDYRRRFLNWAAHIFTEHIHFYVHIYCHSGHLGASFEEWCDCINFHRKATVFCLKDLLLGHIECRMQSFPVHKILLNIACVNRLSSNRYIFTRYGFVDLTEYRLTREEVDMIRARYTGKKAYYARKMCSLLMKLRAEAGLVDPENDFLMKKLALPPHVNQVFSIFNEAGELRYDDGFVYNGERNVLSSCFEPHEEWYVWTQTSYISKQIIATNSKLHKYAFQKYFDNNPVKPGDFVYDYGWNPAISASVVGKTCGFPERKRNIHSLITEDEFIDRMETLTARTAQNLSVFTFISWNHARNPAVSLADATDAAKPYLLNSNLAPDFLIVCECPKSIVEEIESYGYTVYVSREAEDYFEAIVAVHERVKVSYVFTHERYVMVECSLRETPNSKFLVTGAHLHKLISGRDNMYENFVITSTNPSVPQMYVGDFNCHRIDDLSKYDLYDGNLNQRFMDVCYVKNFDGYCVSVPGHPDLEGNPHRILVGQFEPRVAKA
jgi:hypothetical protein